MDYNLLSSTVTLTFRLLVQNLDVSLIPRGYKLQTGGLLPKLIGASQNVSIKQAKRVFINAVPD